MHKIISVNSKRYQSTQELVRHNDHIIKAAQHAEKIGDVAQAEALYSSSTSYSKALWRGGIVELFNPLENMYLKYHISTGSLIGGGGGSSTQKGPSLEEQLIGFCNRNDVESVRVMFDPSDGPEAISIHSPLNARGDQLLHLAKSEEMVTCLISFGADVACRNHEGETPLHRVTTASAANALIRSGAAIDSRVTKPGCECCINGEGSMKSHYGGDTPLHRAKTGEVILALLESGADVHALNDGSEFIESRFVINGQERVTRTVVALPPSSAGYAVLLTLADSRDDFESLKVAFKECLTWMTSEEIEQCKTVGEATIQPKIMQIIKSGADKESTQFLEFLKNEMGVKFKVKSEAHPDIFKTYIDFYRLHLLKDNQSDAGPLYTDPKLSSGYRFLQTLLDRVPDLI